MKNKKKHIHQLIFFTSIFCLTTSLFSGCIRDSNDVPIAYRSNYSELEKTLQLLHEDVGQRWNNTPYPTRFSAELLVASPNRGESILQPEILDGVIINLDAMKQLGVTCISLDIKYPVLVEGFPRQEEYLTFFHSVVNEIRNRNFTLFMAVQAAFVDPVFGQLGVDFSNLTIEQYKIEKRQMVETVIEEFQPDYLTIEDEPETQSRNTGLDFSVDNYIDIVQYVLDGLDRKEVLIGAGAGTWEDLSYIQRLSAETSIDYIDVHIYPIQGDLVLDRMEQIKTIADTYQKEIAIGETWLYKCRLKELTQLSYLEIYERDVFGFWAPLDSSFLRLMVNLSYYTECEVLNVFWMQYLWGYLPYNIITSSLSASKRYDAVAKVAGQNMMNDTLSETGQVYHSLI